MLGKVFPKNFPICSIVYTSPGCKVTLINRKLNQSMLKNFWRVGNQNNFFFRISKKNIFYVCIVFSHCLLTYFYSLFFQFFSDFSFKIITYIIIFQLQFKVSLFYIYFKYGYFDWIDTPCCHFCYHLPFNWI